MSDSVTQTTLGVDARLKSLEESVEARIRSAENDSKVRSDRIEADASARLKSLEDAASATKAQLKTLDDFTKKWKYFAAALAALGLGAASIFGYFVKSANEIGRAHV